MYDTFIPPELTTKCLLLVERTHKKVGIGNLPARLVKKENMLILVLLPPAMGLLGSANAAFKYRHFCWLGGLIVVIGGFAYRWWMLLALILIFVIDRRFARIQHGSYMALAAAFLSLEMLVNDFAGWWAAFPMARNQAGAVLSSALQVSRCDCLDYYLPRRNEIAPSALRDFGPHSTS
jgi:hypothetical protein